MNIYFFFLSKALPPFCSHSASFCRPSALHVLEYPTQPPGDPENLKPPALNDSLFEEEFLKLIVTISNFKTPIKMPVPARQL
jgi:hypothetical protein